MLQEIHIENFALIEEVTIEFEKGFNVLSGETGAGKSILIDAVGLLLGDRASSDYVRTGCEKAIIQGVFTFSPTESLTYNTILQDLGITPEEDGTIILTREISDTGKNACRINGRTVTLSCFQNLSPLLVEIHGQNTTQQLISVSKQAELLDRLGGARLQTLRNDINDKYKKISQYEREIKRLKEIVTLGLRERDFLQHQIEEIIQASLLPGEEESLEKELKILGSSQELQAACEEANSLLLSGEGTAVSAYDLIGRVVDRFRNLQGLNQELDNSISELENAMCQVQELAHNFKSYPQDMDYDPYKMQEIEDRLALISKLKRKYGNNIEDIISLKDKLTSELYEIENAEDMLKANENKYNEISREYDALAQKIHSVRRQVADELEVKIMKALNDLVMPNVKFKISIDLLKDRGPFGRDKIEFLISPNPGEPLKPLAKIASGGEIARIMLSLKSILAEVDNVPVLIFDEIDSGIGGLVLKPVAEKLSETSKFCQVICVTHSPQIAAHANSHYLIQKHSENNKTLTKVSKLKTEEERIEELSRMLGATSKAKEHALELRKQN
ncbi:DNA repair protein RecN [Desulfitibacter alkalitolerans]|uniref:DNA repair protein RecN n=1 Tax=Desulfitibacter alkalitolerans TaxID=264641 RepID=UPI000480AEFA|nr:DNA repair protein RecN [Desulfitibacter alkalitolerans]